MEQHIEEQIEEDQENVGQDEAVSDNQRKSDDFRASRERVQAYIQPKIHKGLDALWNRIRAAASIEGKEIPLKNDFYGAVLMYGLRSPEKVAKFLGVLEGYEQIT